ncbi:MAG: tetratricopeptide repeat protein [bacterium]|nr:tetratricopeptide repeat protein [bacterium]
MLRKTKARILTLIFLLSLGAAAYAQTVGRMVITAKDPDGNPVQGVKVTMTCRAMPAILEEKITNKKGRATFSVVDATLLYDFNFEAEGYPPLEAAIKPTPGRSITRDVTLSKAGETVAVFDGEDEGMSFTPAERAFNRGVKALREGDIETAKSNILDALNRNSKLAPAYSALAGIYVEEGDYTSALAAAEKYRELQPENPRGFRLLYQAHQGLGNDKEADKALEELAKLDKGGDTAAIMYNEGVESLKVGDFTNAKARFLEALGLQPELKPALAALMVTYFSEKNYQEAAATAERLLALEPDNHQGLRIRYDSYKAAGDKAKEDEAFAGLAAVDPQVLAVEIFNKGVEFFNAGNTKEAIAELERAMELDPNKVKGHYFLGLCFVNVNEQAKAKEHLQKFVELAPDDPDAEAAKAMIAYLQ